jgi:hypothetical protein
MAWCFVKQRDNFTFYRLKIKIAKYILVGIVYQILLKCSKLYFSTVVYYYYYYYYYYLLQV